MAATSDVAGEQGCRALSRAGAGVISSLRANSATCPLCAGSTAWVGSCPKCFLFPDAELAEDAAQEVVGDVLAGDGAQSGHGGAQVAADKVERRAVTQAHARGAQGVEGFFQGAAVAGIVDQRSVRRERSAAERHRGDGFFELAQP